MITPSYVLSKPPHQFNLERTISKIGYSFRTRNDGSLPCEKIFCSSRLAHQASDPPLLARPMALLVSPAPSTAAVWLMLLTFALSLSAFALAQSTECLHPRRPDSSFAHALLHLDTLDGLRERANDECARFSVAQYKCDHVRDQSS